MNRYFLICQECEGGILQVERFNKQKDLKDRFQVLQERNYNFVAIVKAKSIYMGEK